MDIANDTTPEGFIFLGFSGNPRLEMTLFVAVSIFYTVTLMGNITIIHLSYIDCHLHNPMYFFLSQLSLLYLYFTISCIPQILVNLWGPDKTISYLGCTIELYIFLELGAAVCHAASHGLLTLPCSVSTSALHGNYAPTAVSEVCGPGLGEWGLSTFVHSPTTMKLPFCQHHWVNDFVCEVPALIHLSCGDTLVNELQISVIGTIFLMVPLVLILVSYGCIAQAVLAIQSKEGRNKAFRTCSSHLGVVFLFYCTVTAAYIQAWSHFSVKGGKSLTLFYIVVTPTLNPLICTLRNKDIKCVLKRLLGRNRKAKKE